MERLVRSVEMLSSMGSNEYRHLKRVHYSAYVPVGQAGGCLPDVEWPPLQGEHRLYQADWLIRLYGFSMDEVISRTSPWLDLEVDPKQALARRHPERFPVDIHTADREMLLRVPDIGLKTTNRIVGLRKKGRLRFEHLKELGAVVSRAQPFIRCDGMEATQWPGAAMIRRPDDARTVGASERLPLTAAPCRRTVFETDGRFEGLLNAIFRACATARITDAIGSTGSGQRNLFDDCVRIETEPAIADRVWHGRHRHLGARQRQRLFQAHLSGDADVERLMQATDTQEDRCQRLWQRYYNAATIRSRDNPTLHRRQLPRRHWRYLTEKNPKRRVP